MTEFTEVQEDVYSWEATQRKYRFTSSIRLIGEFFTLWGKAQAGDWDAYREMISDKFPSEWTDFFPPAFLMDESSIPQEFIVLPVDDGSMTQEERHELRAVQCPDEYSISAWLASQEDEGR